MPGIEYERADGTVERALDMEDAIARCPVLGKWAIDAPDQVSMLLDLAAAGTQRMHETQAEQPKPDVPELFEMRKGHERIVEAVEARPVAVLPQVHAASHVQEAPQLDHRIVIETFAEPEVQAAAEPVRRETRQFEEVPLVEPGISLPALMPVAVAERLEADVVRQAEIQPVAEIPEGKPIEQLPPVVIRDVPEKSVSQPVAVEVRPVAVEPIEPVTKVEPRTVPVESVDPEPARETDFLETETEPEPVSELEPWPVEQIVPLEVVTPDIMTDEFNAEESEHEQLEMESVATEDVEPIEYHFAAEAEPLPQVRIESPIETEVAETYEELTVIIAENYAPEHSVGEPISQPAEFAVFAAEQPKSEEPVTIEVIRAEVNGQPVEQTFVRVAEVLSSKDDPDVEVIVRILRDIEAELPACLPAESAEDESVRITPEMTEKVLVLLRHLGHEQPKEALVGFVRQYGLPFVLQSLEYLLLLAREEERKEILAASVGAQATDEDAGRSRIGKFLFGLVNVLIAPI